MSNALVSRLSGYAALDEAEVALLVAASADQQRLAAHRDLIREGEEPGPVFLVLEGWACRYKVLANGSRQITAFLMPGDFCDPHMGRLERMDHSVGTVAPCRVAFIASDRMEALGVATPALTAVFRRARLVDESVSRAWIVSLGRRNATERVAHLMLELHARMRGVGLTNGNGCEVPLSQSVVADALGLTSVHVNRILKSLRHVIKLGSGRLVIADPDALAKIAGYDDGYLHPRVRVIGRMPPGDGRRPSA